MRTREDVLLIAGNALCCLASRNAALIAAEWRGEKTGCAEAEVLMLMQYIRALRRFYPEGTPVYTYVTSQVEQVDNPPYDENIAASVTIDCTQVSMNGSSGINSQDLYGDGELRVTINGILLGSLNATFGSYNDYASGIKSIIDSVPEYEYKVIPTATDAIIDTITIPNSLRSGSNNSGAYRNTYPVSVQFQKLYPLGACDYNVIIEIFNPESNFAFLKGFSVNGIYQDFLLQQLLIRDYPYGDPLYMSGAQYALSLDFGLGYVLFTMNVFDDYKSWDITVLAKSDTIDFFRIGFTNGDPDQDFVAVQSNCGTGTLTAEFMSKFGDLELANGEYRLPSYQCTYGMVFDIGDAGTAGALSIVIDGASFSLSGQDMFTSAGAVENAINNLNRGVYSVSFNDPNFIIMKTSYDYFTPDVFAAMIDGVEQVRSFEVLSCLIPQNTTHSILQTPDIACYTDPEQIISNIYALCGCCDGSAQPIDETSVSVLQGYNSGYYIDANGNPIKLN